MVLKVCFIVACTCFASLIICSNDISQLNPNLTCCLIREVSPFTNFILSAWFEIRAIPLLSLHLRW